VVSLNCIEITIMTAERTKARARPRHFSPKLSDASLRFIHSLLHLMFYCCTAEATKLQTAVNSTLRYTAIVCVRVYKYILLANYSEWFPPIDSGTKLEQSNKTTRDRFGWYIPSAVGTQIVPFFFSPRWAFAHVCKYLL